MADEFRIYADDEIVGTGTSPVTIRGLRPNTNYKMGDYQAVRVVNGRESERTDLPAFKTKAEVIAVTGVTMSQKTATIKVGETKQVIGTVEPNNATDKTVAYESDSGEFAEVSADGKIKAIAEGKAVITVTTRDGAKIDKCVVTITPAQ